MNIGIVCYASIGGSGIVATELAKGLAVSGHQVRLVSTEPPFRLGNFQAGLAFHAVQIPGYPLFREPQYLLALANKIVEVSFFLNVQQNIAVSSFFLSVLSTDQTRVISKMMKKK